MSVSTADSSRTRLGRVSPPLRWLLLVVLSVIVAIVLEWAGIPAALLLGPLIGGIVMSTNGGQVRVPRLPYQAGQAIVGCLIASVITSGIMRTFLADWPLFVSVVGSVIAAGGVLGWVMSRWSVMPGSTAVWGSTPGGASAMMLMAEAYGADAQLVAFMQYLRVVFVALAASLTARFLVPAGVGAPTIVWFPAIDPTALVETLLLAGIGGWLGVRLRVPAGAMLGPLVIGSVLHVAGVIRFELPEWLLAASYAVIGWNIGLGFTRQIVRHAARSLPQVVVSILVLISFCGVLAFILVRALHIDPVTAYLATSPGGMDSVAIIAASTPVDVPFVMALQTVRFMLVLLLGPWLARWLAQASGARAADEALRHK